MKAIWVVLSVLFSVNAMAGTVLLLDGADGAAVEAAMVGEGH